MTSKDHASFAIYWVPASTTTLNGGLGYQLFNHSQINDAFSVIWNHTFSPTFLNEARANAAGWRYNELESNPQAPFGLPQASYMPRTALTRLAVSPWVLSACRRLPIWTNGPMATRTLPPKCYTRKR